MIAQMSSCKIWFFKIVISTQWKYFQEVSIPACEAISHNKKFKHNKIEL